MASINKFKVKDFVYGKYDYDTIFIEVEDKEYQMPIIKNKDVNDKLIGKEIIIKKFDLPLEKIEF